MFTQVECEINFMLFNNACNITLKDNESNMDLLEKIIWDGVPVSFPVCTMYPPHEGYHFEEVNAQFMPFQDSEISLACK